MTTVQLAQTTAGIEVIAVSDAPVAGNVASPFDETVQLRYLKSSCWLTHRC
ncbi:hypothetical protein O9993_21655 [Vibrio lentus]|nr:hypothetical protein [Vibrio lentus]